MGTAYTKPPIPKDTTMNIETSSYATMMGRMLRAYGRRVAGRDIEELRGLADFATDADKVLGETVAQLRTTDGGAYSWTDIGRVLGITRASAQQRFARYCTDVDVARKVGGQPANMR